MDITVGWMLIIVINFLYSAVYLVGDYIMMMTIEGVVCYLAYDNNSIVIEYSGFYYEAFTAGCDF